MGCLSMIKDEDKKNIYSCNGITGSLFITFCLKTIKRAIMIVYLFIYFIIQVVLGSTKRKYNNYTKINTRKLQMEKFSTYS